MGDKLSNNVEIIGFSKKKIFLVIMLFIIFMSICFIYAEFIENTSLHQHEKYDFISLRSSSNTDVTNDTMIMNVINEKTFRKMHAQLAESSEIKLIKAKNTYDLLESKSVIPNLTRSVTSLKSKTLMYSANIVPVKPNDKDFHEVTSSNSLLNNDAIIDKSNILQAGSVIPATMINGLNSDLAGEVIAIVRQNIYNSSTRENLLIPQGSKIIGSYDSHILFLQERVAVFWHRLIYPDGKSIVLKRLVGSDLEGYTGYYDQVDHKYLQLFGSSIIMGLITGAMQYSQNSNNTNSNTQTVGQTLSGSLGQQLGQTGLMVTQKNLEAKPTIIIRPNYPFNIMLVSDLLLEPLQRALP